MDRERGQMHEGSAAAAAAALQESYAAWQQRLDQTISQDPQVCAMETPVMLQEFHKSAIC